MTLADLLHQLDNLDDSEVIYAEPRWRPSSRALASKEPADGTLPDEAVGMTYLVSVMQAKRIIAARPFWDQEEEERLSEMCQAVIYYGIYDQVEPTPSMRERELAVAI